MLERVHRRRIELPETGIEIALLDWGGDGPLALLHHANGFCAGVWGLVAEALSQHFRVIAMDARGHGESSKPEGDEYYRWDHFGRDIHAVAEILAAEHPDGRVALGLGHSFGGTSLLIASAERRSLFDRLVLVEPVVPPPAGSVPDLTRRERNRTLVEGALERRHVWPSRKAARTRWKGKDFFADWLPEALELYLAEGMADRPDGQVELKCPARVEAGIFRAGLDHDVFGAAERANVPALLLWARRGDFRRKVYEALAARMGNAEVRDVDAGHLVPMERPDLVVQAVLGSGS